MSATDIPQPLPLGASEAQVMERWAWFDKNLYATAFGRELYEPYQMFFYDHKMTMYRIASRAFNERN